MDYNRLSRILKSFAHEDADDLFQHVYLLTHDTNADNPEAYFIQVAKNEYFRKNSSFHKQHSKQVFNHLYTGDNTDILNRLHEILLTQDPDPDADILRQFYYLYLYFGSVKKLSKRTGVGIKRCYYYLRQYERHLKSRVDLDCDLLHP